MCATCCPHPASCAHRATRCSGQLASRRPAKVQRVNDLGRAAEVELCIAIWRPRAR
jgi:hypothetical protein